MGLAQHHKTGWGRGLSHEDVYNGHLLTSWIRGVRFTITRDVVSNALDVPKICRPTYPYSESPCIDDFMDVLISHSGF